MSNCSVSECGRPRYALDLCNLHWQRRRNGVAMDAPPKRARGSGHSRKDGYRLLTGDGTRAYEHIVIAERALGHKLPPRAEVHHINGDPSDNRPANLVICPDSAYHKLLHQRTRAIERCGHADWRVCVYCGGYGPMEQMRAHGRGSFRHRQCSFRNRIAA